MQIKLLVSAAAIALVAGLLLAATFQPATADDRSPVSHGLSAVQQYSILGQVPDGAAMPLSVAVARAVSGEGILTGARFEINVNIAHILSGGMLFASPAAVPLENAFDTIRTNNSP